MKNITLKKLRQTFHLVELRGKKVKIKRENHGQSEVILQEDVGQYKKGEIFIVDTYLLENIK